MPPLSKTNPSWGLAKIDAFAKGIPRGRITLLAHEPVVDGFALAGQARESSFRLGLRTLISSDVECVTFDGLREKLLADMDLVVIDNTKSMIECTRGERAIEIGMQRLQRAASDLGISILAVHSGILASVVRMDWDVVATMHRTNTGAEFALFKSRVSQLGIPGVSLRFDAARRRFEAV